MLTFLDKTFSRQLTLKVTVSDSQLKGINGHWFARVNLTKYIKSNIRCDLLAISHYARNIAMMPIIELLYVKKKLTVGVVI